MCNDLTMSELWSLEGKLVAVKDEDGSFLGAGYLERETDGTSDYVVKLRLLTADTRWDREVEIPVCIRGCWVDGNEIYLIPEA